MEVHRYAEALKFETQRDPLDDILTQLSFLTSEDYLLDLLRSEHGLGTKDAQRRSKHIKPHVSIALNYARRATASTTDVTFLPAYYAILNLMKVCILCRRTYSELMVNRWHGAKYDVEGKDSHSLATEEIVVFNDKGTVPLFYEVITGKPIPKKERLKMRDIYPYILDVSAELALATGNSAGLADVTFRVVDDATGKRIYASVRPFGAQRITTSRQLQALSGFKMVSNANNLLKSKSTIPDGESPEDFLRGQLAEWLLYHRLSGIPSVPVTARRLQFPEELPLCLMFFYMSSVVRYKPDFLVKLKDSKYWPVVAALRENGLYKFLVLFWSFVQQKTICLRRK